MNVRLIANPQAGGGAIFGQLQEINALLRPWADHLDIVLTTKAGDAEAAAAQAARESYDVIISAGGDGTLNECLNGASTVEDALARMRFAIIPVGTANDFATTLGMPPDAVAAAREILNNQLVQVDLGQLDHRIFINVSAGGFIAEASGSLSPALKAVTGKLAYFIGGMQALIQGDERKVEISIAGGETSETWSQDVLVFAVANGPCAGGGKPVAPNASIDDGLLDLITIEPMPIPELLGLIPQLMSPEPPPDPRVRRRQARSITMKFDDTISVNVDGEPRRVCHCDYHILPSAVRLYRGSGPYNTIGK